MFDRTPFRGVSWSLSVGMSISVVFLEN